MLKSTGVLKGIDTYYFPDDWKEIYAAYLIPQELINKLIIAHERKLAPFRVGYTILPKDPSDSLNPVMKKIKLDQKPEINGALVVSVLLAAKN